MYANKGAEVLRDKAMQYFSFLLVGTNLPALSRQCYAAFKPPRHLNLCFRLAGA